jgi:hypothetical protein
MGTEITTPAVDIVKWSYHDLPPSTWGDAVERAGRVLDFIVEVRNSLPDLLAAIEAAQEIVNESKLPLTRARLSLEEIVERLEGPLSRLGEGDTE